MKYFQAGKTLTAGAVNMYIAYMFANSILAQFTSVPRPALNMTLPTFAAERGRLQLLLDICCRRPPTSRVPLLL